MATNFTDLDQLFLEYVNRARLDPQREVARLLADPGVNDVSDRIAQLEDLQLAGLNRGLDPGTISGLPLQALAPNDLLWNAAEGHSAWMLDANVFSHTGEGGSTIPDRIEASGYASGGFGWGENLSWTAVFPGPVDMQAAVINHAAGLFNSDGHRRNILTDWFRETGVAQLEGTFTQGGTDWAASILTQKFAASGANVFLTGVVYTDSDGDGFYSLGEGESGVSIATTSASTVSATHGGYALGIAPAATVDVTLTWGAVTIGATVDLSSQNVKLDLVAGSDDSLRLLTSGDLILGAGASEAGLLGAANLSLQANDDGNLLIGNFGNNTLTGGAGNDTLQGGAGDDTLDGGGGVNTAVFSGDMADYDIVTNGATGITTVTDTRAGTVLNPNDGVNTLANIQYIQFADQLHQLAAPGDDNGGMAMLTAFTTTGFGVALSNDEESFTSFQPGAVFGISFADANPVLNFSYIFSNFDVDIGGTEPLVATINGALLPEDIDPSIFRFTSATGEVTDILSITLSPTEEYIFRIGGAELPPLTSLAEANAFFFHDGMNAFSASSGATGPGVDIPFATMPGWQAVDLSAAQTITLRGFSVADEPGPPNPATAQPSEFQLTFAQPGANLTKEFIEPDMEGAGARVNFRFDQQPISLLLNGEPLPFAEVNEFELGSVRFISGGQVYDALILDDFANDRIHFIQLGGAPLPEGTPEAVGAFLSAGDLAFSPIPDGQPTSYGIPIPLAGIPGAIVTDALPDIHVPVLPPEIAALAEAGTLAELETALAAFAATQPGLDIPAERLSQLAGDLMLYRETEITIDWTGTILAAMGDAAADFTVGTTLSGTYRINLPLADFGVDLMANALEPSAVFQYEQFGLVGSGFSGGIPHLRLDSPSIRMQTFQFDASGVDDPALLSGLFGADASLLVDGATYTELLIWLSAAVGEQDEITGDFEISGTEVALNLVLPGVVGLEAFLERLDQIPLTYVDVTYNFNGDETGRAFIRADTVSSTSVVSLPNSPELLVEFLNLVMDARDAFDAVLDAANDGALTSPLLSQLAQAAEALGILLGGQEDPADSFFGAPFLAGEQLPAGLAERLELFQALDPNEKVSFLAAFNTQERTYDSLADILRAPEFMALAGLEPGGPGDDGPLPPVEGTGDPAIIQFNGFRIDEDEDDTFTGFAASQLTLALRADDAVYSYSFRPGGDDDLVDIDGPLPYAFLIDGVVPRNFPEIVIERITVDGVAYDLMFVRLPDVEGATFVFQLDGATPLPFTSFAAVQDFIEKADDDDAFGPIPAGSPFAPGTDFTFLSSPFASVDTSPQIIEGGDSWRGAGGAEYGRGAGTEASLTVVNGADLTIAANGATGPFVSVGRSDGYGVVTVAGADSSLDIVAGGGSTSLAEGASVSIGRDGGTGGLRILDGGSFRMTDPVGTTSGGPANDFAGQELLWVGRGPDGYGYVDVIGGSFLHSGTGTIAAYGRQGGEGHLFVAEGGTYRQQTTSADDYTQLTIGRDGGFGEAVVNNGRITIQAADNGDAALNIGANSGGFDAPGGLLRIIATQQAGDPVHGVMITGGANSPFVEAALGRNGGGMVEMHGGYFGVLNRGVTYDDDLNLVHLPGNGGDAEMTVGRDNGRGMIVANDGAEVFVSGTDSGRMIIGAGNGSRGEVFLDDTEIRVISWNGEAGLEVGSWNGGSGLLRMVNGSDAEIWGGAVGGYMNIGDGDDSLGELGMVDSIATIRSTNDAWAYLGVATNGGAGNLLMTDSNLTVMAEGNGDSSVDIGRDSNATAMVEITGIQTMAGDTQHGLIAMGGANSGFAGIDIGKNGGSGHVIVNAAYFGALNNGSHFNPETGGFTPLGGSGGMAGIRVGHDGGSGEFQAMNGADIFAIGGSGQGYFIVGDGPDSYGDAHFDASSLVLSAQSGFAFMGVGRRGGEGHLRFSDGSEVILDAPEHVSVAADVGARGGEGTLLVESGSSINGGGRGSFYVGSEYADNPGDGGADGTLTLTGMGSRISGFRELLVGNNVPEIGTATGVVTVADGALLQIGTVGAADSVRLFVGRYDGGHGTLNITDSVVSVQGANGRDGDDAPWEPYTAIGYFGGTGVVNITGTVPGQEDDVGLVQIGGGESRFATLDIGRGAGSAGTVNLSGAFLGTENRGESYSIDPPFDPIDLPGEGGRAIMRIGVGGGSGELSAINNALVFIESGTQPGLDISAPNVGGSALVVGGETAAAGGLGGTGTVMLDDSRLEIVSAGGIAGLRVGSGDTGTGTVNLLNGTTATLEAGSIGFIGVGREGGTGTMTLDGAGTSMTITGADSVDAAIGRDAGSRGALTVSDGAQLQMVSGVTDPDAEIGALLDIGSHGGFGTVHVLGAGSHISVTEGNDGQDGGTIRIAGVGTGSTGLLHIATGATVLTHAVEIGSAMATLGVLNLDGGALTAHGGVSVLENGWFGGGGGTVIGDMSVAAGTLALGDLYDADTDAVPTSLGTVTVSGDVQMSDGATVAFEFGAAGSDLLDVGGALSLSNTTFNISYLDEYTTGSGPLEVMLARAGTGEIDLTNVGFTSNISAGGVVQQLELREGNTELWFTVGQPTVTLSGTVNIREVSPGAVSQAGTQVTFTAADGSTHSTVTDGSGVFSFELDAGISGDLSFVRDYDAVVDKALSIDDVIALFQLVMHPDPATAFGPLDMLAADFDGDETASVDDVIALFGFVMDIPGAQPARYVFIDDADPLPPVDALNVPIMPNSLALGPLTADVDLSLTAILTGDLFGH